MKGALLCVLASFSLLFTLLLTVLGYLGFKFVLSKEKPHCAMQCKKAVTWEINSKKHIYQAVPTQLFQILAHHPASVPW